MYKSSSIFGLLAIIAIVNATSSNNIQVQMEAEVQTYDEKRSSWKISHIPSPDKMMKLTVAIRVDDDVVQKLEKELYEVSDPQHPRYGQHKTIEEITELLNIPESRYAKVQRFFLNNGAVAATLNPNKDMITLEADVKTIENILSTKIYAFKHSVQSDKIILRAGKPYYLPSFIANEVYMVGELLQFPRLRITEEDNSFAVKGGSGSWGHTCDDTTCDGLVTPQVLMKRYNFPNDTIGSESNSMAVAEFQNQYFSPKDNKKFTASCHRDVQVETIVGGVSII